MWIRSTGDGPGVCRGCCGWHHKQKNILRCSKVLCGSSVVWRFKLIWSNQALVIFSFFFNSIESKLAIKIVTPIHKNLIVTISGLVVYAFLLSLSLFIFLFCFDDIGPSVGS